MMQTLILFLSVAVVTFAAEFTGAVVAEHDGSPIVAAAVTLRQGTKVLAELETDDQGKFRAPNLAAGQYTVNVAKANFAPTERHVTMQTSDRAVTIRLMRYGVITGSVIDTAGQGVRNAVVAAIPVAPNGVIRPLRGIQFTGVAADARGRFRVHSLKPGSYVVAMMLGEPREFVGTANFVAPDSSLGNDIQLFPSTARPRVFQVRGGEEHKADFTVYKGSMFSIRGMVSGMDETANVRVQLVKSDFSMIPLALTGAPKGEFQFLRVPPGSYRLVANAIPGNIVQVVDGRQLVAMDPGTPMYGETTVIIGGQDVADLGIRISPLTLKPRVVYEPAASCPRQATIALTAQELGGVNTNSTLQAGVERTLSLTSMPYWVELTAANSHCYLPQPEIDFRTISGDAVTRIVAMPLGTIKGKVDVTGPVAEDYEILLTPADGMAPKSVMVDAESRFSFADLLPGRYRVSVIGSDRSTPATQELDVASGASLEIEFAGIR